MALRKLAIHGGPPAIDSPLPVWPPQVAAITDSVGRALADGSWGQYHGRPLDELASAMASYHDSEFVWLCASGTAGVELALRGIGVRPGQEVVMAGYDFPGNFRSVEAVGARPVLVDVSLDGWLPDVDQIEAALSEETGAVLVSHLHGALLDMPRISAICHQAGVPLVEDACQVPGALVHGRRAGTWGDTGVFSFGGSKLLTAGRGGAVITRRAAIYQRIKIAAGRGNDAWPLSALQAAALLPQWELLDDWNKRRGAAAQRLATALASARCLQAPLPLSADQSATAYYKFPLLLTGGPQRDQAIHTLQAEGLPAAAGFLGFVRRAPRRCRAVGPLTNSQVAAERLILLHHPLLLGTDEQIDQACGLLVDIDKIWADGT